jgi:hypothetical protein
MCGVSKVSRAKAIRLWEGLSRVHSTMTAALEKDMLPEAGMPLGWYEVLVHLDRAPQGMMRFQDLVEAPASRTAGPLGASTRCSRPASSTGGPVPPTAGACLRT